MRAGILRHYPESGGAMEQSSILLENMSYALRTWQIDQKDASGHTPDDMDFMRDVVQPERLTDA
jgi:hypothetical protein